jgi:hypothetical protein
MSKNFFRLIWRFNAIAFAALSVLGLFIGAVSGFYLAREVFRTPNRVSDTARVANDASPSGGEVAVKETLLVSAFTRIGGTKVLWSPLVSSQRYDYRTYGKEANSTRNYIFYNSDSGISHKLLGNDKQMVLEAVELRRPDADARTPPEALLFSVVETDSDGDSLLTASDRNVIMLARADGQGITKIDGVSGRTIGEHISDDGRVLTMVIDTAGYITATHIDLATFKVTRTDKIAP